MAAGLGRLLALERRAFLQAMFSRPLVAATGMGLLLGQLRPASTRHASRTIPPRHRLARRSAAGERDARCVRDHCRLGLHGLADGGGGTPALWTVALFSFRPRAPRPPGGPAGRVLRRPRAQASSSPRPGSSSGPCGRTCSASGRTCSSTSPSTPAARCWGCAIGSLLSQVPLVVLRGLAWAFPAMASVAAATARARLARPERRPLGPGGGRGDDRLHPGARLGERMIGPGTHLPRSVKIAGLPPLPPAPGQLESEGDAEPRAGLRPLPGAAAALPGPAGAPRGGAAPPDLLQHPPVRGRGHRGRRALPRGADRGRRGGRPAGDGVQERPDGPPGRPGRRFLLALAPAGRRRVLCRARALAWRLGRGALPRPLQRRPLHAPGVALPQGPPAGGPAGRGGGEGAAARAGGPPPGALPRPAPVRQRRPSPLPSGPNREDWEAGSWPVVVSPGGAQLRSGRQESFHGGAPGVAALLAGCLGAFL